MMAATHPPAAGPGTGPFLDQFRHAESILAARDPAWVLPVRQAGLVRFSDRGLPGPGDEDWRFTPLTPLHKLPFRPALGTPGKPVSADTVQRLTFGALAGHRLVFVDGQYAAALSRVGPLPGGVRVGSLAEALAEAPGWLEPLVGSEGDAADSSFAALNTAFFTDGGLVHVPDGQALEEPVHLVFLTTGGAAGNSTQVRNLVVAGARSHATVVESYFSLTRDAHFTNGLTRLLAGEEARVEHLKFQDESAAAVHLASIAAELGRASNVWMHSFALGARLSRNSIRARLAGEGLECILNGLYLTRGEQLADHHMIVEHAQPHCASHEYFNGILDNRSRGVFHGRILVHPVAQKTDAKQTNKNILLSDEARVDTKPQLEIYADDVKCTHGATVGQLDDDMIFYLRARGLGRDTARRMLIHAFAGEITERVQCAAVREELDRLLWDRLEQNLHLGGKP